VYELSPPKDEKPFKRKSTPIYFPPEAAADFPVAMQVSDKHKVRLCRVSCVVCRVELCVFLY
jgi:hypothetical protein